MKKALQTQIDINRINQFIAGGNQYPERDNMLESISIVNDCPNLMNTYKSKCNHQHDDPQEPSTKLDRKQNTPDSNILDYSNDN